MLTTLLNFPPSSTVLNLSGSILTNVKGALGATTAAQLSGSTKVALTAGAGLSGTLSLSGRSTDQNKAGAGVLGATPVSAWASTSTRTQAGALTTSPLSARTFFTLKDAAGASGAVPLSGKEVLQQKTQAGIVGGLPAAARASTSTRTQAGALATSPLSGRATTQGKALGGLQTTTLLSGRVEAQSKLLAGGAGRAPLSGSATIQGKLQAASVGKLPLSGVATQSLRDQAGPLTKTSLSGGTKLQLTTRDNPTTNSPLQALSGFIKLQLTIAGNPVTNTPLSSLSGRTSFTLTSGAGLQGRILLSDRIYFQAQQRLFLSVQSGVLPTPKYIMTTSGTYVFNPPIGRMALLAFSRIGVHGTEVLQQHMENAWLETNLLQASWAADGITWWTVELVSVPLVQGTATYSVAQNIISVLDVYINNGSSNRLITPFSRTDYASLAEPSTQGFPTTFWFNRALAPTLNLWPVPDGNATYTMNYYAYTQTQDANIQGGGNAAIPYFWLDAYIADLAHRLSRIYAPTLEAQRKQDMLDAYARANKQVEPSDLYITAGLSSYYRD